MAINTFIIFLTSFSLLCISTSAPTNTLLNDAVYTFSDSRFNSMSLTLEFDSRSSILTPPFSANFTNSVQPSSVDLLRNFHFCPLSFSSLQSLKSLRFSASKLQTFWVANNHSAFLSFDDLDYDFLINGVKIDGSLSISGFDNFLGNSQLTAFNDEPIYLNHFVACKIYMNGLFGSQENGRPTFLDGFLINETKASSPTPTISCANYNLAFGWISAAYVAASALVILNMDAIDENTLRDNALNSALIFLILFCLAICWVPGRDDDAFSRPKGDESRKSKNP